MSPHLIIHVQILQEECFSHQICLQYLFTEKKEKTLRLKRSTHGALLSEVEWQWGTVGQSKHTQSPLFKDLNILNLGEPIFTSNVHGYSLKSTET